MAPVFHQLWLEHVALPPHPKIITGDGEPFIFAKVMFDLPDRDAAIGSLADRDDIVDHGDGSYAWLEPAGNLQRSVGTIFIEQNESCSKPLLKTGRESPDDFRRLSKEAADFRAISYEDVEQAIKRAPRTSQNEGTGYPHRRTAQNSRRMLPKHYRKWLDEPVPALGNRTPRHAARLKTVRPKLITLLKDFESHSERQRRQARSPMILVGCGRAGIESGMKT